MDKKEYIIKQLGRTDHKSYENYCITRIFHKVDNLNVHFVTQQMFKRNDNKIALADLYLPQLNMIIEVDEKYHKDNEVNDKARSEEIIKNKQKAFEEVIIFNLEPLRIDASKDIEEINSRIDEIVDEIKKRIIDPMTKFKDWNCSYLQPQYYIDEGKLNAKDVPSFRTLQDVADLFNRYQDNAHKLIPTGKYRGTQKAWFSDEEGSNIMIWCPKLRINLEDYKNNIYLNEITEDGKKIYESPKNENGKKAFLSEIINGKQKDLTTRYVFAKYKDSVREDRYKFRGIFEINIQASKEMGKLVWEKTGEEISLVKYHKK